MLLCVFVPSWFLYERNKTLLLYDRINSMVTREAEFNELLEKFGGFLRRTLQRMFPRNRGLDIDDIEQEARMRLWRAIESEKKIEKVPSYIFKVAMAVTIDAVRRVKAKREDQLIEADEEHEREEHGRALYLVSPERESPIQQLENKELYEKMEAALKKLSEDRQLAVRFYLQGLNTQEAAAMLKWTEAKARNLMYRGLEDLRKHLKEMGVDYETK